MTLLKNKAFLDTISGYLTIFANFKIKKVLKIRGKEQFWIVFHSSSSTTNTVSDLYIILHCSQLSLTIITVLFVIVFL